MLGDATVSATLAVKDIAAGKKFYGETLGLKQVGENPGGVAYESGGGKLFVYESDTAGKGQATCAFWTVDNLEAVVADLKAKGITFEHYNFPGSELQGDIHVMGPMKTVWFKDPDGNILSVDQS